MTKRKYGALTLVALALALGASASAQDSGGTAKESRRDRKARISQQKSGEKAVPAETALAFESPRSTLNAIALELSARSRRSVALMNGLDPTVQVGPYKSEKLSVAQWMDRVTADAALRIDHAPHFDFIFPAGYEVLNSRPAISALDPALSGKTASLRLDANTPLFSALALLSHSLGSTIVADNVVADARCGHVRLFEVPLRDALDALLRSARVTPQAIAAKPFGEALLLYSSGRPLRTQTWAGLSGEAPPAWMEKRVSIYLPAAPSDPQHLQSSAKALPLRECLAELAKQTGLSIEADSRSAALPVNPVAIVNVPLRTALDLLVHQWPLPHFGYRTTETGIRFVYLGPPIE